MYDDAQSFQDIPHGNRRVLRGVTSQIARLARYGRSRALPHQAVSARTLSVTVVEYAHHRRLRGLAEPCGSLNALFLPHVIQGAVARTAMPMGSAASVVSKLQLSVEQNSAALRVDS